MELTVEGAAFYSSELNRSSPFQSVNFKELVALCPFGFVFHVEKCPLISVKRLNLHLLAESTQETCTQRGKATGSLPIGWCFEVEMWMDTYQRQVTTHTNVHKQT